jgi:hypothetical protein
VGVPIQTNFLWRHLQGSLSELSKFQVFRKDLGVFDLPLSISAISTGGAEAAVITDSKISAVLTVVVPALGSQTMGWPTIG